MSQTPNWKLELQELAPGLTDLEYELIAFRRGTDKGRYYHCKRLVTLLFTKEYNPSVKSEIHWNPWLEAELEFFCDGNSNLGFEGEPQYIGVTGPASSGKTFAAALYGYLCWLSAPALTKVIIGSTSIQSAKNRIWGQLTRFYYDTPNRPGKLLTSNPAMIMVPGIPPTSSIELMASDSAHESQASEKIIGIKNEFVVVIIDEGTEVSHAILEACLGNLSKVIRLQVIFLGNASSPDDPHGRICTPSAGWNSISVEDEMWATNLKRGGCLHLDGLKSPNIPYGDDPPYRGIITKRNLDEDAENEGGVDSANFWRFDRGYWPPTGAIDQIYTSQDFDNYEAREIPIWQGPFVKTLSVDPAFSNDGDRSRATLNGIGKDITGVDQFAFLKSFVLASNAKDTSRSLSHQICDQILQIAKDNDVEIDNVAVDATGTGKSLPDIIDEQSKGKCYRVEFGGNASELVFQPSTGNLPEVRCCDKFYNRVSEIWYMGREYLRRGQLKGVSPELVTELCKRLFKKVAAKKICVESKRDMRKRGVRSPDLGDAFLIGLLHAREKFHFNLIPIKAGKPRQQGPSWKQIAQVMTPSIPQLKINSTGWADYSLK